MGLLELEVSTLKRSLAVKEAEANKEGALRREIEREVQRSIQRQAESSLLSMAPLEAEKARLNKLLKDAEKALEEEMSHRKLLEGQVCHT